MKYDSEVNSQVRTPAICMLVLGGWLIIAPFLLQYNKSSTTWNEVMVGLGVMGLSLWRLHQPHSSWASLMNALLGLWLVFSPFIFGYNRTSAYWNELIFGIALFILALSSLGSLRHHHGHPAH